MPVFSHTFTSADDLPAMLRLINDLRRRGQRVYPIAADLHEELADVEVQVTARLWTTSQELIGFAYINRYQNMVDVFIESEFTPALQAEMMYWLAAAARQRNQAQGETLTLDASALEDDQPRLEMLERFGFLRQAETSLLMSCPLIPPIPDPQLPPGFSIRPLDGLAELENYVNLHRAAFGTDNMTLDYRRSIMSAPDYLPELDLVAVAPNGELAAFCHCQIFADDAPRAGGKKEGWTDPLGTHPAYRRLGLAKALILAGMRLLQTRGMDTALLGTSSANPAMQQVAGSIGFRAVSNTLWYCKEVGGKA